MLGRRIGSGQRQDDESKPQAFLRVPILSFSKQYSREEGAKSVGETKGLYQSRNMLVSCWLRSPEAEAAHGLEASRQVAISLWSTKQ